MAELPPPSAATAAGVLDGRRSLMPALPTDASPARPAVEPPDQAERQRIELELDDTLFVEAGAGSGKTRSLVERVHALVARGGVPMREIAAITFTDKAAAELRDRVRRRFEEAAAGPPGVEAERAASALLELDGAAVCTLHAFAQRILTEHPVAAGLPPRVEVVDEVASQLAFDERWAELVDELLDEDQLREQPEDATALVVVLDVLPLGALRDVAIELERNWDLVAEHVVGRPPPSVGRLDVGDLVVELFDVAAMRNQAEEHDKLALILAELEEGARALGEASSLRAKAQVLSWLSGLSAGRWGNKNNWRRTAWQHDLAPVRDRCNEVVARCADRRLDATEACLRRLTVRLGASTLAAASARRRDGRLAFHDLLVLARELLRDERSGYEARAALHRRYTHLLLDEFQDTDPIQVEIAVLLAAPPSASAATITSLVPEPGRLFFVGDPKQSIYRFRRADIATFLRTRDTVTDRPVSLTANFRTRAPVVAWVNEVFQHIIQEVPGAQPAFQRLDAVRDVPLAGPPVLLLGGQHADQPTAAELRSREVAEVVRAIQAALDGWEVEVDGVVRLARPGDIAVLIPSRTVLDVLEDQLDAAGLPFRTESSSLAYASREVRNLLLALRAIDDASDELALVSILRSPLFGCSDAELLRWRADRKGSWNLVASALPDREPGEDTVHDAATYLRELAADRHWASPAELLDRLVRDRRVLEVAGQGRRARDVWRRLRFLVDQARVWREAGGGTLRDYVAWAYRQASDAVRITEAVLPELDHDAVRIMTIHAAKGLEFPIVVLAGLTTQPQGGRRGVDVLWTDHGPELRLDKTFTTHDYEATRALDDQLDEHERRRLLYVGCTRARDHLVVSVHRRARKSDSGQRTLAELIAAAVAELDGMAAWEATSKGAANERGEPVHSPLYEVLPPVDDDGAGGERPSTAPDRPPTGRDLTPGELAPAERPFDLDRWRAEHDHVLATSGRPRTTAATSLADHDDEHHTADDPGLAKAGVDLDTPPWHKGRYGTAIGRAVHAVLQTVDLATGEGLEAAAGAQAAAEGVLGRERTIAALARSALRSPVVHEALASLALWREVLVAAPIGDQLLEGYIDLLFRAEDGLVVVDYKTDQPRDADDLEARVARYRLQLAAYALGVERITGERVDRAVLVFCSPDGPARQQQVEDLAGAMREVADRLGAASGGTPPHLLA